MTCSQVRIALSARLDGEDPGFDPDDHLRGCAGCRQWLARAEALAGALAPMVMAPRQATPDVTEAVLARLAADRAAENAAARSAAAAKAARWTDALRLGLGGIAAVQLLLALPGVLGLEGSHAHHEVAAVAVAFLLAAFRPALAKPYAPVAVVLAGCLVLSAVLDLAQGVTTVGHETGHLMTIVPAAMLVALAYRPGTPPPMQPAHGRREEVAVR
jgi:predicted anti-sigma-YlaC factor YlaD